MTETVVRRCVRSTWWISSLHFVYIFRKDWNFLTKLCSSDPSFNRNILRSLYLKFKTSADAQIAMTYYYVLFINFLTWYVGQDFISLITWLKIFLFCKVYTVLLPNLLRPNVSVIPGVTVDISSKKLYTKKYF